MGFLEDKSPSYRTKADERSDAVAEEKRKEEKEWKRSLSLAERHDGGSSEDQWRMLTEEEEPDGERRPVEKKGGSVGAYSTDEEVAAAWRFLESDDDHSSGPSWEEKLAMLSK